MMTHEDFDTTAALDALGAATPEEAHALRVHMESCAQCRTAADEYSEAASLLARDLDPVDPPAALRQVIIGSVMPADEEAEDVIASRRGTTWWLATAATLFLALWGWREFAIRVARERITSQQVEMQHLADENKLLLQQKEKLVVEMQALAAAGTRTIELAGQQMSPAASARVFLEPDKRRALVFFHNLPPTPGDKSYQLWVLRGDQPNPQSGGVFDVTNGNATITVENLPVDTEIKGLAVTMEPKGGVAQPTSSNYFVMGKT
jgi:hypothetical protein